MLCLMRRARLGNYCVLFPNDIDLQEFCRWTAVFIVKKQDVSQPIQLSIKCCPQVLTYEKDGAKGFSNGLE